MLTQTLHRLRRVVSLIRLKPFNTDAEEGRANERNRRVAISAMASGTARAIAMCSQIVSVPLTLHYLGKERYGLWLAITSFVGFVGFADLGVGLGLLNSITRANGLSDRGMARRSTSSAFFMLAGLALAILLAFAAAYGFVPWAKVFNVSGTGLASREIGPTVAILTTIFALSIPLSVVERVQLGYQEASRSYLWQCCGSVLGLGLLIAAMKMHAGLPILVLALSGAPVLSLTLNSLLYFTWQKPWVRPSFLAVSVGEAKRLLRTGIGFLVLTLSFAMGYSLDNFIILHILGDTAVSVYGVCWKMFNLATTLLVIVSVPMWAAYGEAFTRGDVAWLERTLWRSVRGALVCTSVIGILLTVFGDAVLRLWTHSDIRPGFSLLLPLGIWVVLDSIRVMVTTFLNAVSAIRFTTCAMAAYAACAIPAKIFFGLKFGLVGVAWSGDAAYVVCLLIPLTWYTLGWISRLKQKLALANQAGGEFPAPAAEATVSAP